MKTKIEEQIIRTEYSEVMQKSFIDYAMSVIVARALPDVRDGLKPVQRRTLYDMHELGIRYDRPYRKCARIVGDTMGKYHPHGDSSIYDSLVVMSQEFKKGMPLVDGHGNFGSIEGDGAAAMRYTEARLQKVTQEAYLADLDKDVVDFAPNFDETEQEPVVLPVKVPNLLINGAEGIAVGMKTSIPPHNMGEIVDGVKAFIRNPDISVPELMEYIKGPDFPTGGIVVNEDELQDIYLTGMGKIRIRGKIEIEHAKGGKDKLVITEIPYTMVGANIGKFLNDVCNLVENKVTSDILDISNQSSKEGIRIVFELRKDADAENLINLLYKKTGLEDTFGVNMLAVVNGGPETMSLDQIIRHHVDFQFELATRKYKNMLQKELDKKEIQEGLIRAYDVIDLIIEILRGCKKRETAECCLMTGDVSEIKFKSVESKKMAMKLNFTKRQAVAILDMRLYKLIGLELEALIKEHDLTMKNIAEYTDILNNRFSMAKVIMNELEKFKKEFGRPRRTRLETAKEVVFIEKKVEEQEIVFLMDRFGYVKTIDLTAYERNKEAAENENKYVVKCSNIGRICLFTNTGQMHTLKVLDIPYGKFRDKGQPIDNLSNFNSGKEQICCLLPIERLEESKILFGTSDGMVKIVPGSEFMAGKRTIVASKLNDGEQLLLVAPINGEESLIMESKKGYFLRFAVSEISEMKKNAIGMRGMKISDGDRFIEFHLITEGDTLTVERGGKEIVLNRLHMAKRDGKGIKK